MAKVLFLTPWYPSEKDAMSGLFVQKHVEAVRAQGVDVQVIHSEGWSDLWQQWRALKRTWGLPDVVQLNIIQKQGALALWLKHRYKIPYVIVEHFTGYLPSNNSISPRGLHTAFMRHVCLQAEVVMTVSPILEEAMKGLGFKAKLWERINNVVDDFFFEERKAPMTHHQSSILLHISCFLERAKNTFALLRGFCELCKRRSDTHLVMVGTGIDWQASQQLAKELGIPEERITWTGEQTPQQVCEWLHKANAFVLTSRYETAGVVLSEAAATGTPILSTPVGIAEEIVNEHTGIIISQEDASNPKRLAQAMEQIIIMPKYPPSGQEYRADYIGKQLKGIYAQVLQNTDP